MTRHPTIPELTTWQTVALKRFARDFERSKAHFVGAVEAREAVQAVRKSLRPDQYGIIELVAGRGRTIGRLAADTGRASADLANLLSQAAHMLARHYEAERDAA
jgi:hypothetical protein